MRINVTWPIGLTLLLAAAAPVQAQTNVEVNQGIQFDFLNPGARSLAMGGAFVGLADDATAALANPAGLQALTRPEIAAEGRFRRFIVPYLQGGTSTGAGTGPSLVVSGGAFDDSEKFEPTVSFVSGVFGSTTRPWTIAGYFHQTAKFSTEMTTNGPAYNGSIEGGTPGSLFPASGDLALSLASGGVAGSYKFQSCRQEGTARVCVDRFSVGAGASYYRSSMDSTLTRYTTTSRTTVQNRQIQEGKDSGFGFNVGVLWLAHAKFQLGATYRFVPELSYDSRNVIGSTGEVFFEAETPFTPPDVFSVGVAVKPTGTTTVVADLSRVRHSRLRENIVDLFDGDNFTPAEYQIDDATEFRAGVEQRIPKLRGFRVRGGFWWDPDHALRYEDIDNFVELDAILFRAGEDVVHFTIGGGIPMGAFEVNAAADLSDRGNIGSISFVWRLGRR
jgi:long-subunit fatty acid transport protein